MKQPEPYVREEEQPLPGCICSARRALHHTLACPAGNAPVGVGHGRLTVEIEPSGNIVLVDNPALPSGTRRTHTITDVQRLCDDLRAAVILRGIHADQPPKEPT